ncbi:hypothetical protein KXQ82_08105 [Mucilaginibacter sp. HMF5004]|uniref:hypothetical protein n=1 Tax=Mucilaginibacter rivuli TaxID=2857527 RepID=UPI001C5FA2B8|nr:hypothetical protein [Mucilaginibacter rivuli]MBW4889675.1 hypothetical protein [Mucilaginibacter rivuli]
MLVFGFNANSNTIEHAFVKHEARQHTLTDVPKQDATNNIKNFFEIVGVAQITTQTYKVVNYIKYTPFAGQNCAPGSNYSILSYRSGIELHSLFRKLILFPFHAFW